ncbi:MAG: glycogen synthase [Deltaproteobacteria bacterium]|nr:glycogen synthase [Deltaproteobacteria bacterium]
MKILFVASECTPFAKAGGLGDVVGALPKALHRLGHDVRVLIPRYAAVDRRVFTALPAPLAVPIGGAEAWCGVLEGRLPGSDVPVYVLEHDRLFGGGIYDGFDSGHGLLRFGLLSRGAFQLCRYLGWTPDIFHAHDWPTGWVPAMLETVERRDPFLKAASVFTIHNMAYQPRFYPQGLLELGLPLEVFRPDALEDHGQLNPFKGGLWLSSMLTTVSPTYAKEIGASPGGSGLESVIQHRGDQVVGILNGIDEDDWDPERDRYLPAHFNAQDLSGKLACKRALQAQLGLAPRDVPLLGVVSRLTHQKGIDVLAKIIERVLGLDVQMVVVGSGDAELERSLVARSMVKDGRFFAWIGYNEELAHRIEAASDLFLMPSRFEPCGLNQMYSQRYGTLPVVRGTGGLVDTVEQCDLLTGRGTGFIFWDLHEDALYETIRWAVSTMREEPLHFRRMQRTAMHKKQGWDVAAKAYEAVYRRALQERRP